MNENKELFERMPVPRALAKMAIPTIVSQLITMIYNLADTFFIGQTNDPYKVAASSVAFILFFILGGLSNLFGVGGGSLISRLLGQQREEEAKTVSAFSLYGTLILAAVYSVCNLIFMEPLLRFMGASDNTIGYASAYILWVVVVGGIPTTMAMTMSQLMRSVGRAREASFGLSLGGVLNIILDPIFMFVLLPPGNEVTGAAVATMISNVISFVYFCVVFARVRGTTVLSASFVRLRGSMRHVREVFAVGLPSTLSSMLACASNMVINQLAVSYGDIPLAAIGIVKKIDMLPLNVGMGLCQGMLPLVAYNYAAKNYSRMREIVSFTRKVGMGFAVLCIVAFELLAGTIVSAFIQDADTVCYGTDFLRICCLATPVMICNFQMTFTLQAMGKGPQSLVLSTCRQGLANIPLLFLMNSLFGLYGLVWTQLLADGITLIISFVLYHGVNRKLNAEIEQMPQIGG